MSSTFPSYFLFSVLKIDPEWAGTAKLFDSIFNDPRAASAIDMVAEKYGLSYEDCRQSVIDFLKESSFSVFGLLSIAFRDQGSAIGKALSKASQVCSG